jgi:hypothetical protein
MPAAALAVVAAAHAEAHARRESTPQAVQRAVTALADAGWAITPSATLPGRQTGVRDAA